MKTDADTVWKVFRDGRWAPMCELCFEPAHDGPCPESAIEYWTGRAKESADFAALCFERARRVIAQRSAGGAGE